MAIFCGNRPLCNLVHTEIVYFDQIFSVMNTAEMALTKITMQ